MNIHKKFDFMFGRIRALEAELDKRRFVADRLLKIALGLLVLIERRDAMVPRVDGAPPDLEAELLGAMRQVEAETKAAASTGGVVARVPLEQLLKSRSVRLLMAKLDEDEPEPVAVPTCEA